MIRWKALALVAVAAAGLGCERTPLLPQADDPTRTGVQPGPDAGDDAVSDTLAPLPEVEREVGKADLPVTPEVGPSPDTVEVRPALPDAGPDLGPAPTDTKRDVPADSRLDTLPDLVPPPLDQRPDVPPPDLLPPRFEVQPDLPPSRPEVAAIDLRPAATDSLPPPQLCASGEACTSDCKAPCQGIGTSTCTCTGGTLACGTCQQPNLVITLTPCPSNAAGTACDTSGQACPVYSGTSVTGLCACLDRGPGLRWNCLNR